MDKSKYIQEDRISFGDLVERLENWIRFLFSVWKKILIGGFLIAAIYVGYQLIRKPVYTAETTFVLETTGGSDMGQISSLASTFGINLGALMEANSLFQTDNIVELYRSRKMLYETFMSTHTLDGKEERLITRFGRVNKKFKKWKRESDNPEFTFEVADREVSIKHDSILFEVIEDFRERDLIVEKPDRRLSILSVRINSKDQLFAKRFNEVLVSQVNEFYSQTKTKKTGDLVTTLQKQADSVKLILDDVLSRLAKVTEQVPNPNPIMFSSQVPIQKLQIDAQTTAAVYAEIVKNLELAKINHLKSMPLIQVIDEPMLPIPDDKYSILKTLVFGGIIAALVVIGYFTLQYIYRNAMKL